MIEVSEYVQIADPHERARVRAEIVVEQPATLWAVKPAQRRKAELLAAEAGLRLLDYFEQAEGEQAEGELRPAYVLFDYDPAADPVSGPKVDIVRVLNRQAVRLWEQGSGEREFDADVTNLLVGAFELDPAVFYNANSRWAYALPF